MSSAWGAAWASAWDSSWGAIQADVVHQGGAVVRAMHHATPEEIRRWHEGRIQQAETDRLQRVWVDDEEVLLIIMQAVGGIYG